MLKLYEILEFLEDKKYNFIRIKNFYNVETEYIYEKYGENVDFILDEYSSCEVMKVMFLEDEAVVYIRM